MTTNGTVNGVNVEDLQGIVAAIQGDRTLARAQFRAQNRWIDGGNSRTRIQGYYAAGQEQESRREPFRHEADEPPVLLGTDRGANPVEFALSALASCLTTSLVYHAAAQGIELTEVESTLEGDLDLHGFLGLDESIRNGYENIRIKFKVKGDASDDKLAELVELAQKRSPVFDIVTNPVSVSVEMERQ